MLSWVSPSRAHARYGYLWTGDRRAAARRFLEGGDSHAAPSVADFEAQLTKYTELERSLRQATMAQVRPPPPAHALAVWP